MIHSQSYLSWLARNPPDGPLSVDDLAAAFLWSQRHGSSNCFTGSSGTGAGHVRKLLAEIERLKTQGK